METKEVNVPLYSNAVRIKSSTFDFMLDFGLNNPVLDEKAKKLVPQIAHLLTIYMSPQHYKAFCKVAVGQLEQYEAKFGEIKIEKGKATAPTRRKRK